MSEYKSIPFVRGVDDSKPENLSTNDVKVQIPKLIVDISGVNKLVEKFETLHASVWETTDKVEALHNRIDSLTHELAVEIGKLKAQQDRIELSLTPILALADEQRKTNAHLDKVLSQLTDYLNQ